MASLIMEAGSVSTKTVCATPFLIQEITVSLDTNSATSLANANVADADPAVNDTIWIPNQGPGGAKASLVIPVVNDRALVYTTTDPTDDQLSLGTYTCDAISAGTEVEENDEVVTGLALASATVGGSTIGAIKLTLRGESGNTAAINGHELRVVAMYFEQASGGITA